MAPAEDSSTAVKPLPPPRPPPSPERAAARRRFLDGVLVGVVLAFAFLVALFPARNSDFFLHAATGRLIAHGDGRPMLGVDPFAFTTRGAYWVNHNWLYDLIVYLFYDTTAVGGTILIVLKALMIAALAEVMLRTARAPGRALWVPVCCVGLAVLTLSPKVQLQPISVSFFFLGVTYWLLHLPRQRTARAEAAKKGPPQRRFLPYWLIPPLCLLWVNMDSWFLLGPITVALYLVGETLQDWLAADGRGRSSRAPGEQRTLLIVLLASVAACLVNPHHVHAFTAPPALGLSEAADVLGRDDQFYAIFCSPFESYYYAHPQIGLSVAGLAFYPLIVLGLASFAAAQWVGRWPWERALVWTAFLALAVWRAGAIPFFAVVAGPIASLNFLDFATKRLSPAPAVAGGAWALGGRILTLLAGVALLVAVWPGWLQGLQPPPVTWRRVGWTVEPDPALVRMTQRIKEWQQTGMPPGGRWVTVSPIVLPYLAWYCPGEQGCIDNQRLPLYDQSARDFKLLRDSLAYKGGDADQRDPRWRKLLRSFDVHFVICYEPNPLPPRNSSSLPALLSSPEEWPLLYGDGPAVVFGWRDPAKDEAPPVLAASSAGLTATAGGPGPLLAAPALLADRFVRYEVSAEREAFGAEAAPTPTPKEQPPAEWWAALWTPETPRPPEADEAAVQLERFVSLQPRWEAGNEPKWATLRDDYVRSVAGPAAATFATAGSWHALPALAAGLDAVSRRPVYTRAFDLGPPAPLYLTVRAARRALAVKTDDALSYLYLAQAYHQLMYQTREGDRASMVNYPPVGVAFPMQLRRVQMTTALHRALELDPNNRLAEMLSKQVYLEAGFLDLTLLHAREELRIAQDAGVAEKDVKAMQDDLDRMQKQIQQKQDAYLLKTSNKPVTDKVQTALDMGLGQTALEELLKVDWNAFDDKDPNKLYLEQQELNLLMQTGRVDEVVRVLKDDEEKLAKGLGFDPTVALPAYEWLRVQAAAARGDYADADHWLEEIEKNKQEDLAEVQRLLTARMVGNVVLRNASSAGSLDFLPVPLGDDVRDLTLLAEAAETTSGALGRVADLEAVRGWLAMEAGDVPKAREHVEAALKLPRTAEELALDKVVGVRPTDEISFRARPLAELCRELLNAGR